MNREVYIQKIADLLGLLESRIKKRGNLNLRDINFHCENFYRDLLNIVYDLDLINLNTISNNQDTIDLGDKTAKKSFQVTSSVTKTKVDKTIKGFEKHLSNYDELFMIFIVPKEDKFKKTKPFESTFGFDIKKHLLDNTDLLKKIQDFDIDKIRHVHDFIVKELDPKNVFNSEKNNLIFDKYMDNWRSFIENSSIEINDKSFKSYSICKGLCEEIFSQLSIESIEFGRFVLCDRYNDIDSVYYQKMFRASNPHYLDTIGDDINIYVSQMKADIQTFKNRMEEKDRNERWDFLKNYIGRNGHEREEIKDVLLSIGQYYFYKVDFEERQHYYKIVLQNITAKYGDFLDGYINRIDNITKFISNSPDTQSNIEFLNSQLSKFDSLILIYYLLGGKASKVFSNNCENFIDFKKIISSETSRFMIDSPYLEELKAEIAFSFTVATE